MHQKIAEIVREEMVKEYVRRKLFGVPLNSSPEVRRKWMKKRKAELEAQGEVINIDLDQRY